MHWKTQRKIRTVVNQLFVALAIACGLAIGIWLTVIVSKNPPTAPGETLPAK